MTTPNPAAIEAATPTPRTDALIAELNPIGVPGTTALIPTHFARQLERELAAAQSRLIGAALELTALEKSNAELRVQWAEQATTIAELGKYAAQSDKELLQLQDWLIGNAEFDKGGLIDRENRLKERIRDLIAAEGTVGELAKSNAELREALWRIANDPMVSGAQSNPHNNPRLLARDVLAQQPTPRE